MEDAEAPGCCPGARREQLQSPEKGLWEGVAQELWPWGNVGPCRPPAAGRRPALSPASPSSVVGISHWLSSAVTQRQEASSHEPPGAEKQVGNGGWLDLGGGRQVDNGQHRCRDPHVPGHPRFCSLRGLPGLGLRKLESVDQGVPGLASPSPRQAAPCPQGMCGWAGSSASG